MEKGKAASCYSLLSLNKCITKRVLVEMSAT